MPYTKAPQGGICVVCRKGYRKGDKVAGGMGGWLRHLRCQPPTAKQ